MRDRAIIRARIASTIAVTRSAVIAARIRSTHVHDNDGRDDQHLFPLIGGGTIDWGHAMDALRLHGDRYPLMLELREVPHMTDPLSKVIEVFERLEHTTAHRKEQ
mgnify:CR=1 FL=1